MGSLSIPSLKLPKLAFIFFYRGNYSEGPSAFITNMLENNIRRSDNAAYLKNILFLVIEALQNIEKYSAGSTGKEDLSLVFRDNEFYYVFTENLIDRERWVDLSARLESLQDKSPDEITAAYFEQLNKGKGTDKGAGLGLIEIARKTKKRVFYSFVDKGNNMFMYSLCFALPLDKNCQKYEANLGIVRNTNDSMLRAFRFNERTMLYSGDFSNVFLKTLLDMLRLMKSQPGTLNRKTHHILIELIQNINKHGLRFEDKTDANLVLEWNRDHILISTGNMISEQDARNFEGRVKMLNVAGKDEIERINREHLADMNDANGHGLIDIANLIFPNRIGYQITQKENGIKELNIAIRVNNE